MAGDGHLAGPTAGGVAAARRDENCEGQEHQGDGRKPGSAAPGHARVHRDTETACRGSAMRLSLRTDWQECVRTLSADAALSAQPERFAKLTLEDLAGAGVSSRSCSLGSRVRIAPSRSGRRCAAGRHSRKPRACAEAPPCRPVSFRDSAAAASNVTRSLLLLVVERGHHRRDHGGSPSRPRARSRRARRRAQTLARSRGSASPHGQSGLFARNAATRSA